MASVTRHYKTTGMHCHSCSMLIQLTLQDLDGVEAAHVDHRTGISEVVFDDGVLSDADIVAAITKAGYGAEPATD
ncbi:MAG: heavy-metal-associated domain-containing protein [Anaerosomatales bacterium]|nr:heavy-metal-associated domain-containing protein [Anaerosomatales bacterium]